MKILFVASEAVPWCKTGGLADVVGTLAQKLSELGHDVCLFLPKYRAIQVAEIEQSQSSLHVELAGQDYEVGLLSARRRAVTTYFVDFPSFFDRDGLYGVAGRNHEDNSLRFALFCLAALEGAKAIGFKPDIVHAHDWQTGPVCVDLKRRYASDSYFAKTGSVFTVHNMAYQGNFPRATLEACGFSAEDWTHEGLEYYGQVSYLKAGLAYADRLTTVSPTYAREIQESRHGFGFEGLLRRRSSVLSGILNGLDTETWDPARDAILPRRYGCVDAFAGKSECKKALRRECRLEVRSNRGLIGIVSRLDYQKGLDLAIPVVEARLDRAQLVVVGTGDQALAEQFSALESRHPHHVHFHRSFDDPFAHRVYAASDLFLMPSRFEPCGLGQMIAMRYGCVPVVARTGGLVDTVTEQTGFLCESGDGADLGKALDRALDARRSPTWGGRVRAAMVGDFSWEESVKTYLDIYRAAARS